ncbi:MAG: glutamate-5-semialdehyde dehydrogenase [Spirochaetales bacterium]|nr:glutamate-5-semialdehyde dehydrogenase [Spirochaetales bacterium]
MEELMAQFSEVRRASSLLSVSSLSERREALASIARLLEEEKDSIRLENNKDVDNAEKEGIASSILHRLVFSDDKIKSVEKGYKDLCNLPDPIGKIREKRELDPGFVLEKKTFPIGVIGMIFEARPDALLQIAGLSLLSGNGLILKGGKEAAYTNRILVDIIKRATSSFSFGSSWILGIESREDVKVLLSAEEYVDLLIPRGSNKFVRYCMENTRIPVMGHSDGKCHTFIDKSADFDKAVKICVDAKVQYSAACNATETFLVHKDILSAFLPKLEKAFIENNVKIHADEESIKYLKTASPIAEGDVDKEYLDKECNIIVIDDVKKASQHINAHGSHHTDAIITEDQENAAYFVSFVDSADVFVNCSTRFADGFRFGLGAEVGISTSKLHARGPVGLDGLMTTKWILRGNGETVGEYSGANGKEFHHKELI